MALKWPIFGHWRPERRHIFSLECSRNGLKWHGSKNSIFSHKKGHFGQADERASTQKPKASRVTWGYGENMIPLSRLCLRPKSGLYGHRVEKIAFSAQKGPFLAISARKRPPNGHKCPNKTCIVFGGASLTPSSKIQFGGLVGGFGGGFSFSNCCSTNFD